MTRHGGSFTIGDSEQLRDGKIVLITLRKLLCTRSKMEVIGRDLEIVSSLTRCLIERLGQDRFDLWFGRGVRFEWREGVLAILATDQFILDRLKLRFRPDLTELSTMLLGHAPTLEFTIDTTMAVVGERASVTESLESQPGPGAELQTQNSNQENPSQEHASQEHASQENPSQKESGPSVREPADSVPSHPFRRRFAEFSSFVTGDSNRVAVTAATMVAARVGRVSPLLIYGPNGCGKTHLLEALLMKVRHSGTVKRSVLISAEQFTTHFLDALQGSGLPNFRRKYRDVELLLVDDVQFFAGKRATLVELQHTLDTLLRAGRQVVLTADRPPAALTPLGSELVARMTGGLVCGVEPADYASRLEIARRAATQRTLYCPDCVLELIAQELSGDARQIAGALNRLEAASEALQQPVTLEFAQTQLSDLFQAACRLVRLPDIEEAICEVYGLGPNSLQQSGKSKELNEPRMLAMWLARKYTRAAFSEIGEFFGGRSHSTVIAAQKRFVLLLENGATTRVAHASVAIEDVVRRIEHRIRAGS